jgi:hypothetical protein
MNVKGRLIPENENQLVRPGAKMYARNKEALDKTRASRGIADGYAAVQPLDVSSARVSPAIIALRHNSRDKAIVMFRDGAVKREGDSVRVSLDPEFVCPAWRAWCQSKVEVNTTPWSKFTAFPASIELSANDPVVGKFNSCNRICERQSLQGSCQDRNPVVPTAPGK